MPLADRARRGRAHSLLDRYLVDFFPPLVVSRQRQERDDTFYLQADVTAVIRWVQQALDYFKQNDTKMTAARWLELSSSCGAALWADFGFPRCLHHILEHPPSPAHAGSGHRHGDRGSRGRQAGCSRYRHCQYAYPGSPLDRYTQAGLYSHHCNTSIDHFSVHGFSTLPPTPA